MKQRQGIFGWITFSLFVGVTTRVALLLMLAGILGFVANTVLPSRILWVEDWGHYIAAQAYQAGFSLADYEAVQKILAEGQHMVLDSRPLYDYEDGHIEMALSLPADDVQGSEILHILSPSDQLLIYCSGLECDDSLVLAHYLQDAGFTNLTIYPGGWTEWSLEQGGQP